MAKLVLSSEGSIVHQCFVDKEVVSIGREAGNALVIDDPDVASRHAAVVPVGNDHILEDLHSGTGTVVNGTKISRHILQHGDVVQFGSHYLRYLNPKAASDVDLERTMLISGLPRLRDPAPPQSAIEPHARSTRRSNVHFPSGRVRASAGARSGKTIVLDRVIANRR